MQVHFHSHQQQIVNGMLSHHTIFNIKRSEKMMDVMTLIQTLGFPIACVVGIAIAFWQIIKSEREENSKREDRLYTMIENNTKAIQELTDYIKRGGKE